MASWKWFGCPTNFEPEDAAEFNAKALTGKDAKGGGGKTQKNLLSNRCRISLDALNQRRFVICNWRAGQ
jgi:hypothetical protein